VAENTTSATEIEKNELSFEYTNPPMKYR